MKDRRRLIIAVLWIVLGAGLFGSAVAGLLDSFWSGMGGGLIAVGVLRLVREVKYRTNEVYREKMDVELKDERNRFLANKAWAWAGYLFVLIAAVSTIVFKLLDMEDHMMMASGSVCLLLVLYWVCYVFLRKKY